MKKILLNSLLVLGASALFTSCLKDKGYEDGKYGIKDVENGPKIIEIPQAAVKPYVHALNTLPATELLNAFELNYAKGTPASEDITVTLVKNMTLVSDYNAANGTGYIELPANAYTLPNNLTVVIPKGSQKAAFQMNLIKGNFDFSKAYALGYSIASVTPGGYTISQNFKNIMITVGLKNKFDGIYELTMTSTGWGAYGIGDGPTAIFPPNVALATAGADDVTVIQQSPSPFGNLQPGWAGGVGSITAYTSFGGTTPRYRFNSTSNKVTQVVNTTPDDGRGRVLNLDPASTTSQFNPATKAINIEYFMGQNGRPNQKFVMAYRFLRSR